jgi:prepilin-type N-terminal cleavage/methylation domain-containing protein
VNQDLVTKNKKGNGYTLIELLLVVGLLAIAVGVTSDILLNLVRSYNRVQVFNEIEQQTNFIIQKLEKEIRNSVSADQTNRRELELTIGTQTITYWVDPYDGDSNDGTLYRTVENSDGSITETYALNSVGTVGGVYLECAAGCFDIYGSVVDTPIRVRYDLKFRQSQQGAFASESGAIQIYNFIVLRRSYK